MGTNAAEIHSNRSQQQRREALDGFRCGRYRVLVATDIASRGIDVKGIELVLNYDLPASSDDYVHRIGRTARAGEKGHAITFALPYEKRGIWAIERLIRKNLPISKLPELAHVQVPANIPMQEERETRVPRQRTSYFPPRGQNNRFRKAGGFKKYSY